MQASELCLQQPEVCCLKELRLKIAIPRQSMTGGCVAESRELVARPAARERAMRLLSAVEKSNARLQSWLSKLQRSQVHSESHSRSHLAVVPSFSNQTDLNRYIFRTARFVFNTSKMKNYEKCGGDQILRLSKNSKKYI